MLRRSPLLLLLSLASLLLAGCYYSHPRHTDHWTGQREAAVDSEYFVQTHFYWTGYNFEAVDSLRLATQPPLTLGGNYEFGLADSVTVYHRDPLVVARVLFVPGDTVDSVWVKVARDQWTQGWVRESELLDRVVPDDPIAQFIYHFSDSRSLYFLPLFGLAIVCWLVQRARHKHLRMVHLRDIPSFYPTLLCLSVSGSAALYGSIQRFVPGTWVEYYFHPTLNPFEPHLPFIMALFIASVWFMVIAAVAVIDEIRRQPDLGDTIAYMASLAGVCIVIYLVFTITVPLYFGYLLLAAYWYWACRQYYVHRPSHLICGVCKRGIPARGQCPHCGAWNE